eukprot:870204_1
MGFLGARPLSRFSSFSINCISLRKKPSRYLLSNSGLDFGAQRYEPGECVKALDDFHKRNPQKKQLNDYVLQMGESIGTKTKGSYLGELPAIMLQGGYGSHVFIIDSETGWIIDPLRK